MPLGIGESRGCRRACKQCTPANKRCLLNKSSACTKFPVVKEYHQGVVMTGAGKPPKSIGGVTHPDPKCFLYWHWYDFENDKFYRLNRAANGQVLGYDVFDNGHSFLPNFELTAPGNVGSLGSVLSSSQILALQNCVNVAAASQANRVNSTSRVAGGNTAVNIAASTLNCAINQANRGNLGFIYGNPPIPAVTATLTANQGYTLTPDIWLVPGAIDYTDRDPVTGCPIDGTAVNGLQDFGWIVFLRDARKPAGAGAYYRDSYNSKCNDPGFPASPCDGDLHADDRFNLLYQFDADLCRWFLIDTVNPLPWGPDALNQGLGGDDFCELEDNRNKSCKCECSDDEAEQPDDDGCDKPHM